MKKKSLSRLVLGLFLLVMFASPSLVNGLVLDNPDAGIEFWIPDGWSHKVDGEDLVVYSPDEELSLVLTLMEEEDIEPALTECYKKITEAIGEFTLNDPEELEINGMKMLDFSGEAMGGQMKLSISLLLSPTNRIFTIFAFATEAAVKRFENDLIKIVQGLKPRKSSSASKSFVQKARLATPRPPASPPPSAPRPPAPVVADSGAPWAIGDSCYIEGDKVSLRAGPGVNNNLIAHLNFSDFGEVIGTGPRETIGKIGTYYWIKIRVGSRGGLTGWVFGAFLRGEGGC